MINTLMFIKGVNFLNFSWTVLVFMIYFYIFLLIFINFYNFPLVWRVICFSIKINLFIFQKTDNIEYVYYISHFQNICLFTQHFS